MFLAKGRSVYARAELRRFILETGRTFGILQINPEPALKALASEVSSEVGGLAVHHSPTGWKQAQGAVGALQSNLYAQVRALKLDLEARYPGFDLPTKHPLFPWLVKHAQWLLKRYAQKSDGLTPFEKRWSKPYSGSLCRFAEVVHFRKVGKFPKSLPAWEEGLWLGRDTESNQHFVASARRPQAPPTSSASAVRAGSKSLAGVTSGKAVGSGLPRRNRSLCVSSSGPARSVPGSAAT